MSAFTLCFTFPKRDQYQRLQKEGGIIKIMPLWTFDELCDMARFETPSFSIETIQERYYRVGGIPRWIFASPDAYNTFCEEQDLELRNIEITSLTKIIEDIHALSSVSHKLIAIHPHFPFGFRDFEVSFLSDYVISQLLVLMDPSDASVMSMVVQSLKNVPRAAPYVGSLFEVYCGLRLSMGGSFTFKRLSSTENIPESQYEIPPMERMLFDGDRIPSVLKPNILYYSRSWVFPAIDAFALINGEIMMFQFTVAQTHVISEKISQLTKDIKNGADESYSQAEAVFVFVVPEDRFETYVTRTPPSTSDVAYGVLLIPLKNNGSRTT